MMTLRAGRDRESGSSTLPPLTRREIIRVGGISVIGAFLGSVFRPFNVRAQARVEPLGTARKVIFIMLDGGVSQLDSFDAKEGKWTPREFEIRSYGDVSLPSGLFPNLPEVLDKVTVVRSLNAWDAVHGRAQYYVQTGHPLNLALAKEVPSIGSVVSYELARSRRPSDSLPAFVAMNAANNQAGLINQGFLPAEFGPMSLAVKDGPPNLAPKAGTEETFRRRWQLLQQLDETLRGGEPGRDRSFTDYHEYYKGAYALMSDPRVPQVFNLQDEEKKRYGNTPLGNSLILARNLVRSDAGTRFVLVGFGGWDFHTEIYTAKRSHQVLSRELDVAYTSLIKDLASTPSSSDQTKTLLDETLVVCMSEFGRTPGDVTEGRVGREHYMFAGCGLFAGGGVKGGRVLGKTDGIGAKILAPGWSGRRPIYIEDVAATIYCLLGIDWTKTITNTPSGRAFHYLENASATEFVDFQPVADLWA
jgi:hypothetical protein